MLISQINQLEIQFQVPVYLLSEGEFVTLTQLVFQVEGWSTAFQTSTLQEGNAVAQHLGLIQVVRGHDDGATWEDAHETIKTLPS